MAVNRFTGATNNNWGTATNWSQGTVPTATDTFTTTFDGTSPNCTVNTSNRVCQIIDFTGYTNTITMTFNITVSGNITFGTGMLVSGAGVLAIAATSTVTTNGKTWPNAVSVTTASAITIAGGNDFVIGSSLSWTSAPTINKTTAEKVQCAGLSGSLGILGTAEIVVTGGTINCTASLGNVSNITLNGNITLTALTYKSGTLKYSSGTISGSKALTLLAPIPTVDTNGMTWGNVTVTASGGGGMVLASNFSSSGTLSVNSAGSVIFSNTTSETMTFSGGVTATTSFGATAGLIITGGTWSGGGTISNNITISGSCTVSGGVFIGANLTYTTGTVTTTSSTLNLTASSTLDTNGISWNNITLTNTTGKTYTLNSLLTATGTLTIGTGAATTFAGTSGFSAGTLSCAATGATTISLKNSITYTVTTAFNVFQSRNGAIVLFTSDDATLKATLKLTNPSTCNCNASFTRIDASGGRSITTFNGVLTSCINIVSYQDYTTVGV